MRPDNGTITTQQSVHRSGLYRTLDTRLSAWVTPYDSRAWHLRCIASTLLRHSLGAALRTRDHLPVLLRLLRRHGAGAEIGVCDGDYSEIILRLSRLTVVYSIDPWVHFADGSFVDVANAPQEEQERRYRAVVERFARYGGRSRIMRATSAAAAAEMPDGALDFVYIDANHRFESVRQDLALWWPKLRGGGIFAGHDYVDGTLSTGEYGVKRAVDAFVAAQAQPLFVIPEAPPSWYLFKPAGELRRR